MDAGYPTVAVIVFSKDRPCQLLSSLSSLRHLRGASLDVNVLYKATSGLFKDSYSVVQGLFRRGYYDFEAPVQLHWLEEGEQSLGQLLEGLLKRLGRESTVLLTVDDALWFDDFDVRAAVELLQREPEVYAVHAKLCPRVEYAHPNNRFMRLPPFREAGGELLIFERSKGEYDWNYPWELSASLYRLDSVLEVLEAVKKSFGASAVDHPNHLEGYGVRLAKQEVLTLPRFCACLERPVVHVVTLNRVQTLFENPVYGEMSTEDLDSMLRRALSSVAASVGEAAEELAMRLEGSVGWWMQYLQNVRAVDSNGFDLTSWPPEIFGQAARGYMSMYWDRVHVPLTMPIGLEMPLVSWLMPVRDTPASWLEQALGSIERQEGVTSWELVCVDDASTSSETLEKLQLWEQHPRVRVLRLGEPQGIARALNEGWTHCRGRYIARLDGDDYSHPQRLLKQIGFLEHHPSISILGGGFYTFSDQNDTKRYRMPCHPVLARWHMLFSCSLAHPTVTFRAASFTAPPYPEQVEAEDHWCWLKQPMTLHLANLADAVTFLRRHSGQRSASHALALRRSSMQAVRSFVARHQGPELGLEHVEVLWGRQAKVDEAGTGSILATRIEQLIQIEHITRTVTFI